jgi:hypothetical protein
MNAEEFVSGYVKGSDLPPGYRKRMRVAAVSSAEFDDGRKLVIFLDEFYGRGLPLNQTRLRALIEGCGVSTEDWVGRELDVFHTSAFYQGKSVPAVGVTVVEHPAVAAPAPQSQIGRTTFTSGRAAPAAQMVTPTPRLEGVTIAPSLADDGALDYPEGYGGAPIDDDVPF